MPDVLDQIQEPPVAPGMQRTASGDIPIPTYQGVGAPPPNSIVRTPDGGLQRMVPVYTGVGAPPPPGVAQSNVPASPQQNSFDAVLSQVISNRQAHAQTNADLASLLHQRETLQSRIGFGNKQQQAQTAARIKGIDARMRVVGQSARMADMELSTAMKYAAYQNRAAEQEHRDSAHLLEQNADAKLNNAMARRNYALAAGQWKEGDETDRQFIFDNMSDTTGASKGIQQRIFDLAKSHDTAAAKTKAVLEHDIFKHLGITADQFAAIPADAVAAGRMVDAKGNPVTRDKKTGLFPPGSVFSNKYTGAEKGDITQITGLPPMNTDTYNKYRRAFGFTGGAPQPASTQAGPSVGEQRVINGVNATWDGKGWKRVQ